MTRARRILRRVVGGVLAALLLVSAPVAPRLLSHNFGTVAPGSIYRSAQMPARALARTVRAHQIRSVLNLRGANPGQAWYRAERAATLAQGATQVDVSMASDMWLSRAQARSLVRVLDTIEYPILIHCQWGAERTGLVSALTELLRPGGTLAGARRQFSAYYLYIKAGDGAVMAEHLDLYEAWLHGQNARHSPTLFRRWVAEVFRPNGPSREQWPYDPYPPVIISRPPAPVAGGPAGTRKS